MKIIVTFVLVLVLSYIRINGEGVSECYFCELTDISCDEPGRIQKCPTEENNICLSAKWDFEDGVYKYLKGCFTNTADTIEMCSSVNQTAEGSLCYFCNEDLCNLQ